MPRVLIADKLSPAAIDIFKQRGVDVDVKTGLPKDELLKIVHEYDGIAIRSATKVDKDVIAAAKNLKVVARAGIGVDNVDIPAATAAGVVVMNTPFGNSITTAEHAIAMMFALARQLPAADQSTQAGKWEKNRFMGVELYAKTLGLIGAGNIGGIVADRALGLKMKVVAYDPFLSPERAVEIGVEKVELEELLARADIITLHTPLTDKTRNILSAENLAKTKKGVLIVNCARGGLVDEAALRKLLDEGHVGGAAFDVFVEEPAKENPLFGAENFIATPHLGASTNEAQENVALQVAEQMSDYLLTGAVTNALNSPSVTAEEAPRLKPFVALAEKLGALAGQMVDFGIKSVDIAFEGEVSKLNTRPLSAAALAGVLRPMLAEINMVSAPAVAKERGITVSESKQDDSPIYESLVRITVTTEKGKRSFAGTVQAGAPRVVEVKGMDLDAPFAPRMLYINNLDKPGFIGALGGLLGEAGVNIATFNLGRIDAGDDAIALVGVDQEPTEALLAKIQGLPHVKEARALRF
ncbi:MAG: phosphoglycerate dehydrogenase [Phenylobacterium sp.]|jgi:D-3-phosphoglycerate dehydrogenase|uniref:phosphoglycerate dehydrogenase n=1 Tax=unclassified Phenylobacterium TaxID=2640670 RepID=UPI0008C10422|nr:MULTISPECIES: phosphoglycerate dehydrogenase [unclassified Phenylobacterium]MBJ7409524.1 phosphoglycerate dehydrogenase [Phenylobacterium sp.]OHB26948.1 MAG: phosphoglycerate dehydrogenase [Phenylobacterium sp. RIFCSPHIGHO2_01_FULL_69_31]